MFLLQYILLYWAVAGMQRPCVNDTRPHYRCAYTVIPLNPPDRTHVRIGGVPYSCR